LLEPIPRANGNSGQGRGRKAARSAFLYPRDLRISRAEAEPSACQFSRLDVHFTVLIHLGHKASFCFNRRMSHSVRGRQIFTVRHVRFARSDRPRSSTARVSPRQWLSSSIQPSVARHTSKSELSPVVSTLCRYLRRCGQFRPIVWQTSLRHTAIVMHKAVDAGSLVSVLVPLILPESGYPAHVHRSCTFARACFSATCHIGILATVLKAIWFRQPRGARTQPFGLRCFRGSGGAFKRRQATWPPRPETPVCRFAPLQALDSGPKRLSFDRLLTFLVVDLARLACSHQRCRASW